MDAGLVKWALEKQVDRNGFILEVGCGGGETIHRLSQKYSNIHIEGIDYSETAVILSIKKNRFCIRKGTINIQQGDVEGLPYGI